MLLVELGEHLADFDLEVEPSRNRLIRFVSVTRGNRKRDGLSLYGCSTSSMLFCHSLRFMSPVSIQNMNDFREEKFKRGALRYQQIRQGIYNAQLATLRFSMKCLDRIFNTKLPILWRLQSVWKTQGIRLNKTLAGLIVRDYRVFEHSSPEKSDLPFLWSIEKVKSRCRIGSQ